MWLSLARCLVPFAAYLLLAASAFAFDFDMENGRLSELAGWVGQVTQKNYIVPPSLDTPLTLNLRGIPFESVESMFTAVVRSTGNHVIQESGFYLVQPGLPGSAVPDLLPASPFSGGSPGDLAGLSPVSLPPCDMFAVTTEHQDVTRLVPALTSLVTAGLCRGESVHVPQGGNVLLIGTTPERITDVKKVVALLDLPASRLLVRAVIFEETLTDAQALGVNLSAGGLSAFVRSLAPGVSLSPVSGGGVLGLLQGDFDLLVNAVISSDRVKVLSTPEILLDDRSQGRVSVGQNVPFITGAYKADENGGVSSFQTIERKDVGVTLNVFPVVLSPGLFKLKLQQDASSVSASSIASDIITNTRNINTEVTLRAGEVIYLGGLYSEDANGSITRVPLLSSIPYLGWFFRSHKSDLVKRRLSVILSVQTV